MVKGHAQKRSEELYDHNNIMRWKHMENILRIAHYKMYLKYLTGSRNARNNCKNVKNTERTLIFFVFLFSFSL